MSFPFNNKPMSEEAAQKVYDILVDTCGAKNGDDERATFVYEYTSDCPTHEYRFCGELGMGGKFRYPSMIVTCYEENRTPKRDVMITSANERLAQFKASMNAEASPC